MEDRGKWTLPKSAIGVLRSGVYKAVCACVCGGGFSLVCGVEVMWWRAVEEVVEGRKKEGGAGRLTEKRWSQLTHLERGMVKRRSQRAAAEGRLWLNELRLGLRSLVDRRWT